MFKRFLALLLALILALPTAALAEEPTGSPSPDAGESGEAMAELPPEGDADIPELSLELNAPELPPEDDADIPELSLEPEPDAPELLPAEVAESEAQREPEAAETESRPEVSLAVRLEVDELLALWARVEPDDLTAGAEYRWQAAERAALLEAASDGADAEPLWADIEGADREALDVRSAFGDAFVDYCYRCLVCAGEFTAASEPYSFAAGASDSNAPEGDGEAAEAEDAARSEEVEEEVEEEVAAHPLFAESYTELRFAQSNLKLGKGERYTPALIAQPEGALEEIRFSSNKPGIFSVNEVTGEIEGLKSGKGKLTASAGDLSASVTVQVCPAPRDFSLEPAELEMGVGEISALEVAPSPKNAYGRVKLWQSDDEGVVAVEDGKLRAVAPGEAKITATLYNDLSSECTVTVREAPRAEGMTLMLSEGGKDGVIGVGEIAQAAVRYENAAGSVEFRSESEAVASVDAQGKIKGVAPGKARIVARAYNGAEASLEIEVKAKPTKIELANAPKTLGVGEPWTLQVKLSNKAGGDCGGGVTFRSSKPGVLKVDPRSGELTAKKPGSAKITATTYNKIKKSVNIVVKRAPTGFALSAEQLELGMGQSGAKLKVTYAGKKQFGNVHWENENPGVVKINQKGALTPVAPGSSEITATVYNSAAPDEPFVRHCTVTVKPKPVKGDVRLAFLDSEGAERKTIGVGESVSPKLVCGNGGGGGFALSSNKKAIATASKAGVVKGKKKGKVKITAKTYNNIKASAAMKVVPAPKQLRYSDFPQNLEMPRGSTYKLRIEMFDKDGKETELMTHRFESSDPDVVTVDGKTGRMEVVADSGSATIRATAYNGVYASITVFAKPGTGGEGGGGEGGSGTLNPSIQLNPSELALKPGETAKLIATLTDLPGVAQRDISWDSSDRSVATVSGGLVSAVAPGSTQITASVEGSSGPITAKCQVTVSDSAAGLILSDSEVSLVEGRTWLLGATLRDMPGVAQSAISWSSDPYSVATVSGGRITAVAPGEAVITATVRFDGESYSATCNVTVTRATYEIRLDPAPLDLYIYDEADISATLIDMPETSVEKIAWSSSKTSVASVEKGHVVAKAEGEAEITAKLTYYNRTVTASCAVTVSQAPASLKLNPEQATLYVNDSMTLTARPRSLNRPGTISWRSEAEEVAKVEDGVVYAVAPGSVDIIASVTDTLEDGSEQVYTATCKINVEKYPPEIRLNPAKMELREGETATIEATLIGMPADTEIRWTSGSDQICSVEDGVVLALAEGEAEITASATDADGDSASASCQVSVSPDVSLRLNAEKLRLKPGEEAWLTASFTGGAADEAPEVSWEIDSDIASVSDGAVRANSEGRAQITAKAEHPSKPGVILQASCALTVTANQNAATKLESAQLRESEGRVELRWELSDADSYGVYEVVGESEILRGVVTDGDLYLYGVSGGTHTYVVRPRNLVGGDWVEGEASAPMTVEVPEWRTPPEPKSAVDAGEGKVKLSWSKVSAAECYAIFEVPEDSSAPREIMRVTDASVSVELAEVEPGWHSYSVAAVVPGASSSAVQSRAASESLGNLSRVVSLYVEGWFALDKQEIRTHYGDKVQLIPEVHMPDGVNPKVTWTSSNEEVATVDENGWVTPLNGDGFKGGGQATITVSIAGGNYTAKCEIYVKSVEQEISGLKIKDGVVIDYTGDPSDIIVPYGIRAIGSGAFDRMNHATAVSTCHITSVFLPPTVTIIGEDAFLQCEDLERVTLSQNLEVICDSAFQGCSKLTSISLPHGLKSIGRDAFLGCSLSSLKIPESVTSIGAYAFGGCNMTSVTIPDSVTELGAGVFYLCRELQSTSFPSQITTIPGEMYEVCESLTNVEIPDYITSIGAYAFADCCNLASVSIPSSVTSIYMNAFENCDALTHVEIPEGVQTMEECVFWFCDALQSIQFPASLKTIPERVAGSCPNLTSVTIPEGVTAIKNYAFLDCGSLMSVTIPDSVASIGYMAFDSNTTICCSAGSYAEQWAIDNKIPYSTVGSVAPGGDFTIGTGMKLNMYDLLGPISESQGYWSENPEIADFDGSSLTGITAGTVQVADVLRRHIYTIHVVGFQVAQEQIPLLGTVNRQPVGIRGTWSSSNPQVASVDQSGNVKGLNTGTATITVTQDENLYASYTVEVVTGADEILTEPAYLLLAPGEGAQIHLKAPSGQIPPVATFLSSNDQVASVDADGNVTARSYGRTRITAQAIETDAVAVCDVVVVRDTDGARAEGQVAEVKAAADLLLQGHATFDGGYYDSNHKLVKIDLSGAMEAAMAAYQCVKGEAAGLYTEELSDGMYLAEKILKQYAEKEFKIPENIKQAKDVFFGAAGLGKDVEELVDKFLSMHPLESVNGAASLSSGQISDPEYFEKWYKEFGNGSTDTGLQQLNSKIKTAKVFVTILEGFLKFVTFIQVDKADVRPIIDELHASRNFSLRAAGAVIDYVTDGALQAAQYIISTVGGKEAMKQVVKALETSLLVAVKSVPQVGWFFVGAKIGKDVGYAVSDFLFNASNLSTAAFNLEKAVRSAKSYKSVFQADYNAFLEDPASLERLLAFHDSLQVFSAMVKAEYSEYESFVSKYSDAAVTRLEDIFNDARKNAKEQVATLKGLGEYYNTATMDYLIDFRKNCDGKDF